MGIEVTINVTRFDGTPEELSRRLRQVPNAVDVRTAGIEDLKLPVAPCASARESISKAENWLDGEMASLQFVQSDHGAIKLFGRQGYFSGGAGLSAMTIFNFFCANSDLADSIDPQPHHPWDVDDFKRCAALLDQVPEWRVRISELALLSPVWSSLSQRWSQIEDALRLNNPENALRLIKECYGRLSGEGETEPAER